MKLLIAIPALNEEQSIASIIERCLAARQHIVRRTPVTDVAVTVVSDGSTDRTVEIARQYADRGKIQLIVFEQNRGYGAAIMQAWQQSDAELLSFLDADGTCDPMHFIPLCNELEHRQADVVLGCRITPATKMPPLRRLGNALFACLMTLLAFRRVRDTASGMRVVRRSSLLKLLPLPTGLHFTPAMSARALMSRDVEIVEVDMPYHEREGASKLHPVRDGLRFLNVILKTAMLHRPSRPLGVVACVLLAMAMLLMAYPARYYVSNWHVQEWMVYRFLVAQLLMTVAVLIWSVTFLGSKAASISLSDWPSQARYHGVLGYFFSRRWFWMVPAAIMALGAVLVLGALRQYVTTGEVTEHWSRFVAMVSCASVSAILIVTKIVDYCLNLVAERLEFLREAADGQLSPANHLPITAALHKSSSRRAA